MKSSELIYLQWRSKDCVELWINRPDARNAYSKKLLEQLMKQLIQLKSHKDLKICLIRSQGKDFCAGGDINSMLEKTDLFQGPEKNLEKLYKKYIQKLALLLSELNYLTIAVVQGGAIGAGVGLSLGCDLVWMLPDAYLKLPFFALALVPADGSFWRITKRAGYAVALDLLLTARKVEAHKAKELGLTDYVGDEQELLKKISEYQTRLFEKKDWEKIIFNLRKTNQDDLNEHLKKMRKLQSKLQLKDAHNRVIQAILK